MTTSTTPKSAQEPAGAVEALRTIIDAIDTGRELPRAEIEGYRALASLPPIMDGVTFCSGNGPPIAKYFTKTLDWGDVAPGAQVDRRQTVRAWAAEDAARFAAKHTPIMQAKPVAPRTIELWKGSRKITVYLDACDGDPPLLLKVWGPHIQDDMESVPLSCSQAVRAAFDWLYADPQKSEAVTHLCSEPRDCPVCLRAGRDLRGEQKAVERQPLTEATCEWSQDGNEDGSWFSACGGDPWCFESDDPTKNGMRFCIHCGKRMVQLGIGPATQEKP